LVFLPFVVSVLLYLPCLYDLCCVSISTLKCLNKKVQQNKCDFLLHKYYIYYQIPKWHVHMAVVAQHTCWIKIRNTTRNTTQHTQSEVFSISKRLVRPRHVV